MAGVRKKLFCLREYDEAFRDVFSRVIRLRGEEAYPLLKEIPIDAFTASAEASGREYGEQTMRQLLKYSGTISEAMGNAVAGKGRRLGWPVILEVLEGVEIDFDENGEPDLPKMMEVRWQRQRDCASLAHIDQIRCPCAGTQPHLKTSSEKP
jgi:hypothetical protein